MQQRKKKRLKKRCAAELRGGRGEERTSDEKAKPRSLLPPLPKQERLGNFGKVEEKEYKKTPHVYGNTPCSYIGDR